VIDHRVIDLNQGTETGKASNVATTNHTMHLIWDSFREIKNKFESKFDELICTEPDQMINMQKQLEELVNEVKIAWGLKQDQLVLLHHHIVHHENYKVTDLLNCTEDLQEYIHKLNRTAWDVEKPEMDQHLQEVIKMKIDIQTHACPCVWSSWTEWTDCSTTCHLPGFPTGSRKRKRTIEKQALNNGTACEGDAFEHEGCNEDVCCPVNCVWSQWNEWTLCPSGCDQKKIRTRVKKIFAHCNGIDCEGQDYEVLSCSRERELEDEVLRLEQQLKTCNSATTTTTNITSINITLPAYHNTPLTTTTTKITSTNITLPSNYKTPLTTTTTNITSTHFTLPTYHETPLPTTTTNITSTNITSTNITSTNITLPTYHKPHLPTTTTKITSTNITLPTYHRTPLPTTTTNITSTNITLPTYHKTPLPTTTTKITSIVGRCIRKEGKAEGQSDMTDDMSIPNLTPGTTVTYNFKTSKADGSEGNQNAGIKIADYQSSNFWQGDESVLLKRGSTSGSITVSESGDGAYAHISYNSGTWSLKLCTI